MTTPFVCVVLAYALIWFPRVVTMVALARMPGGLDNRHPRDQQAKLEGWGRRANAAHNNTFEAFAPFAAAVFLAHLGHADAGWASRLSLLFVAMRVAYPLLYIANADGLRSTAWLAGTAATVGLFLSPWLAPAP